MSIIRTISICSVTAEYLKEKPHGFASKFFREKIFEEITGENTAHWREMYEHERNETEKLIAKDWFQAARKKMVADLLAEREEAD